jgi:sensor c-di-GMP phosphodiesterase-like protein
MRRRRYWLIVFISLLASALLPSALFLTVSYRTLTRTLEEQMLANANAAIERSEAILKSVEQSLEGIAKATQGTCDETSRRLMTQAVYNNINIREMGVVADAKLLCSDAKLFSPPVPIRHAEHLVIPEPGKLYVSAPTETLKSRSILVHRRISEAQFVNALVYPEVFGEALAYFRVGEASGVYLLDDRRNPLLALGKADADLPKNERAAAHIIRKGATFYAVARSEIYPISSVITATRPWFLERWWRDGLLSLLLGLGVGALLWWTIRRFLPHEHEIDDELQDALDDKELHVHYQPIVALDDNNRAIGYEALLRWIRASGKTVLPGEFIARAERSGFVTKLTEFVLQQVKQDRLKFPGAYIAVNLSALDLRDSQFAARTITLFDGNLQGLMLEITERELLVDENGIVRGNLEAMIAAGARVALDDFGSGYCGLNYLRQFPIQLLKMDQSFTRSMGTDAVGAVLAERIVEVARSIGLDVVAEGIESEAIAEQIKNLGIKFGQGWLYGHAQPAPRN